MDHLRGYLINAVMLSIFGILSLSIIIAFSTSITPEFRGILTAISIAAISRATTNFVFLYTFRKASNKIPRQRTIYIYEGINAIGFASAMIVGISVMNGNLEFNN
ncbi:hypothetical protein MNBD_GAMMA03-618 [hydrothermal vent metagenome]|uniref:Uncharacterized protein n=1 Tax=hydrothermal vent metagenome TaxID=652676 RepID=A0A3B0VNT6_9ZZZZ